MCKCFLGRRAAYWLTSSFGGAFFTKTYITLARCLTGRPLIGQCFIISHDKLLQKQPNTVNKASLRLRSHLFFHLSALHEGNSCLIDKHRKCHCCCKSRENLITAMLFPDSLVSIPTYSMQIQPGRSQKVTSYTSYCQFLFLPPPTHSPSLSLSTYLSPPASVHPLLPVCWRMNCQSCLQYQLLCVAREQRTEGVKSEVCVCVCLCV